MILEAVHRLPDEATFDDIEQEIAFLAAVREARKISNTAGLSRTRR
jgi:hypothetical protein